MKLLVLTVFLVLFIKVNVFSQEERMSPKNYLGLGIGYSIDHIKDTNLSPLNQKGNSLFYSIFYEKHSKNIFKFNINYGDGVLKSGRSNKLETSYYKGNIGITYLKNLSKNQQQVGVYIGGSYNLDVLFMDWYDLDAFSYLSNHGVSISGAISKQLSSKHYVESIVSIPVVQYVSRPPYNGLDEYIIENQDDPLNIIFNGGWSSFKTIKSLNWSLNYKYKISNYFNWGLGYNLNIQKVKTENQFNSLSNNVSTSILYKF